MDLRERIQALAAAEFNRSDESLGVLAEFRAALNEGACRVAEAAGEGWLVNAWVKQGILLHGAYGRMSSLSDSSHVFDSDVQPLRQVRDEENVRVACGAVVRDGVRLGQGAAVMSGSVVNMGVWLGDRTVVDSQSSVGLCAQIGDDVYIGTGVQIGGLVQPIPQLPVVICDEAVIAGSCGIYGRVIVGSGAALAAGVCLNHTSRVYDAVHRRYYKAKSGQPLVIPPQAIVVPGARPITQGPSAQSGLMLQVPVVVAYRDSAELDENLLDSFFE